MADTRYLESIIHWFINVIIYPFYRIIFFFNKNCWRLSIAKANKLGFIQISNATEENRYPEIFDYVRQLEAGSAKSILSFGCSYGPECRTLRLYFPNALIVGYDLFEKNIGIAIKQNNDNRIIFTSEWDEVKKREYEAVFAMSVLCRTPHTLRKKDISNIYPFIKFEEQITEIDSVICKGGLFVLYNSNFIFTHTDVSKKYNPVVIPDFNDSGVIPKFDKNNKVLKCQEYPYSIFRKNGDSHLF